ncbi:MAG: aldehyde ferredoxin oxidoreductase N-terminal domain-containing protein, partial [Planctomycetota bacterium]
MAGYCGKLLRVNLSTGEINVEKLDMALAKKFIGGRGLGTYLLSGEIDPGIDPLDSANKIIFATGPLTGSRAPAT